MSAHRASVVLAPAAEADIEDIIVYTSEAFGERQATTYANAIRAGLRRLARFPLIGMSRPEFFSGARSHIVRHHVIYYQVDGRVVNVVRILHRNADAARQLATDPPRREDSGGDP